MRPDRPLMLLLAALTAGCADPEPFIDFGSSTAPTMNKPQDPVLKDGSVKLCFSDATPWAEVQQLAHQACANHGLQIYSHSVTRWQCRATSPHSAVFRCYDPEMLLPDGSPVNPFDRQAVTRWEKLTGKTARPHNALTARGSASPPTDTPPTPPTMSAPPAPAPVTTAPPPTAAPLSPADIAGKPPLPPRPDLTPPPTAPAPAPAPSQGAYPTGDGFTLPQGSWGDHFQD